MQEEALSIRAHHLLCIQGFQGHGYNETFKKSLESIITIIKAENLFLKVISHPDQICSSCPFLNANICQKGTGEDAMHLMDQMVMDKLGLEEEDVINADILFLKTYDLDDVDVMEICGDCSWRELCLWYLSKTR